MLKVLICTALFLGAALCSFGGGNREPAAPPSPERSLIFVMVPKGVHPYFEPVYHGFEDAAKKYGIVSEIDAPPRFDVVLQVKVIEDLIARGVNGIAISANDDKGLVAVIHEAVQAGIKVITVDAPAPSSEALTYIGTDNESTATKRASAWLPRWGAADPSPSCRAAWPPPTSTSARADSPGRSPRRPPG